jgi:hypothetical protein
MATKTADEPEKMQIPVSRAFADELARWAKGMEWTQGHLAKVLLELGTDDPKRIAGWLSKRARDCARPGAGPGWLQRGDNSELRLQVIVELRIRKRIKEIASALNQTDVRMAALLLDFALCDEKWAMQLLKTKLGKAVTKLLGRRTEEYESAEIPGIDDGNT